MAINSQFTQAVENKEIAKVRARIINSISRDPSLQLMSEMLAYAEPRLDGLFQTHNGIALKNSPADWNSEYASSLAGQLMSNFSRERLEIMCKVTQFVQGGAIRMRKEKSTEVEPLKVTDDSPATVIEDKSNELMAQNQKNTELEHNALREHFNGALRMVDDVILKNYLTQLSDKALLPLDKELTENNVTNNVRLFKITEMVYEKNEFVAHKLASVMGAMSGSSAGVNNTVFLLLNSDGIKTDFYLGVRTYDINNKKSAASQIRLLEKSLCGQFPGVKTRAFEIEEIETLLNGFASDSISIVSTVADFRDEETKKNAAFLQGLDKFAISMQGEKYSAVILAESIQQWQVAEIRHGYENIYTQMSPMASSQIAQGTNWSENSSVALTVGSSNSTSTAQPHKTRSVSKENTASKVIKSVGVAASIVGAALSPFTGGISIVAGVGIAGITGLASGMVQENITDADTPEIKTLVEQTQNSKTETFGLSSGGSNNFTVTMQNKTVASMLERIDSQLKRLNDFEGSGCWSCAAYFTAPNNYAAELAAANYRAIMSGSKSGIEVSAINTWGNNCPELPNLREYITNFIHPVFAHESFVGNLEVTPGSFVSSGELALHMGLPRRSVSGFPVIEHADFAQEIVSIEHADFAQEIVSVDTDKNIHDTFPLGCIYSMGKSQEEIQVCLSKKGLTAHTFVTGTSGSGKSNTIYTMIDSICPENSKEIHSIDSICPENSKEIHFLVIEPAKGEYKTVFGGRSDVSVFGTNPYKTSLLHLNPFSFPDDIHVLEHIDRLVEIFNACWPMYAAMPAILKEAVEEAYIKAGWNLKKSICDPLCFPSFVTLLEKLPSVIDSASYSQDTKSDYKGALITRISSLTKGIFGQVFNSGDIPADTLFDSNVVVDISRVGSSETKALLMGILILKLQEYRTANAVESNSGLRHITVLEEAHNLLRRTGIEQSQESANLTGKSVEMIANSIAEMRTYGEGFIIADQSPGLLDISVIRNTNTKIILRLPEAEDRELVGRAAGMNDNQITELAKLGVGVAAIYQSNWVQPVLCKVNRFDNEKPFLYSPEEDEAGTLHKFYTCAFGNANIRELTLEEADTLRKWRNRQLAGFMTLRLIDDVLKGKRLRDEQQRMLAYNLLGGKRAAHFLIESDEAASVANMRRYITDQMESPSDEKIIDHVVLLILTEIGSHLDNGDVKERVERILEIERGRL